MLLAIDLGNREVGIETGYGVEDIIRDIDANDIISGKMKEYLGEYMNTKEPEYLNKAVIQATEELNNLLGKADEGVLLEEEEISLWDIVFIIIFIYIAAFILALISEGSGGISSGGYYGGSSGGSSSGGFGGGSSGGGGASGGF